MQTFLRIASNVSTPLALAGIFATIIFGIFKEILKRKSSFPALTKSHSFEIYKHIVTFLFILSLVAMALGFLGFILAHSQSNDITLKFGICAAGIIAMVVFIVFYVMRSFRKTDQSVNAVLPSRNEAVADGVENPQDPLKGKETTEEKQGYEIIHRSITCHFTTPTACTTEHEIVISATSQRGLSQYRGRYPLFEQNEAMVVKPPHRLLKLDVITDNWQNFIIQLVPPLEKADKTLLSMNFKWVSNAYADNPDALMVPFCKTHSLSFHVSFKDGLRVCDPVGELLPHAGSREPIKTTALEVKENTLSWGPIPNPTQFIYYRLAWKWIA